MNKWLKALVMSGAVLGIGMFFIGYVESDSQTPDLFDLRNNVRLLIKERATPVEARRGCGLSATTTDCARGTAIPPQLATQPVEVLSPATLYTEVAPTNQSGEIDLQLNINNSMRMLRFCDKQYKSRQIIVDGIDVAQRIAELATRGLMPKDGSGNSIGVGICKSMPSNMDYTKGILETPDVTKYSSEDSRLPGDTYRVYLSSIGFDINPATGDIYMIGAYDGSLIGPVGKLK